MKFTEKSIIGSIRRQAKTKSRIVKGIGDDCAVLRLPAGHAALITTDFTLEAIHFRREWHPPEIVGHRCLARGLSDIAAMGGTPIAAFLSLALPRRTPPKWVDRFMKGLLALAQQFGVSLAGGDTAESPAGIFADVMVVGSTRRGKAVLRSGAHPNDGIYVTGELGGSAATLKRLFLGQKLRPIDFPRHFRPIPRLEVGNMLRERQVSAMIDTSDGLSTDLSHICEESGVGAEIYQATIPRAHIGKPPQVVDLAAALHGGEDYELLFTASDKCEIPSTLAGVSITEIGRITNRKKIVLIGDGGIARPLTPQGFQHFST